MVWNLQEISTLQEQQSLGVGGAAGLESGTGADSMQSAASLTANPASAGNQRDIALGDGCFTSGGSDNIMIGGGWTSIRPISSNWSSAVAISTSIALHANARATGSTVQYLLDVQLMYQENNQ